MLWRALQDVERGFYFDVGAQSPDSDSVTKAFSLAGWRGINVEPHPSYFDQLRDARPNDINLNVALGEQRGSVTMSLVENSGLSTADEKIAAQHAASGYSVRRHAVEMLTLAAVWQQHVPVDQQVHFLKVDVEGLEQAVLAGNDWRRNRPWIVLVEATLPNSQVEAHEAWEPILLGADYLFSYADGLNRFYVAREHAELCSAFKFPPNVFDGFTAASEYALQLQTVSFEQRLASAEAAQRNAVEQSNCLRKDVSALDRTLGESLRRIECTEVSAILAREREMALKDRVDTEWAVLRAQIAEYRKSIADAKDRADVMARRAEAVERQYSAVIQSPWWRITGPGRAASSRVPGPIKRQIREIAKAAWWAVTPWHLPARWRAMRGRRRIAAAASAAGSADQMILYPDRSAGQSPMPPIGVLPRGIADRAGAARWCLDVLRSSPEIRERFPLALSSPESSGFIDWIRGEGGERLGLSGPSKLLVVAVLKGDFGGPARRAYYGRPDVCAAHPDGLRPQGQADLYRWFMQFGCAECNLTPEEVLWFFTQASEAAVSSPERRPRLALDTYVLAQGIKTGVYRVCEELFPLLASSDRLDCRLYVRPHDEAKSSMLTQRLGVPVHFAPSHCPSEDAEILLSPFGVVPSPWSSDEKVLHAHIVYDLIGVRSPEYFPAEAAAEVTRIMNSLDRKTVIFAISEFTKRELLAYRSDLDERQVTVVPLAAGPRFHPCDDARERATVRAKYGIPPGVPYVLSLATLEIRKNLDQVVRALVDHLEQNAESEIHLVLSGMSGWKLEQLDEALARYARWRHRIVLTGFVEDADLAALYSDAHCFVYLSRAEGFGLPPLEAMACGTPVICSDNTSLPEVVGQAGLLFDANDTEGVAHAIQRIASSPALRHELSAAGLDRARLFSWARCADIITETLLAAHAERCADRVQPPARV